MITHSSEHQIATEGSERQRSPTQIHHTALSNAVREWNPTQYKPLTSPTPSLDLLGSLHGRIIVTEY